MSLPLPVQNKNRQCELDFLRHIKASSCRLNFQKDANCYSVFSTNSNWPRPALTATTSAPLQTTADSTNAIFELHKLHTPSSAVEALQIVAESQCSSTNCRQIALSTKCPFYYATLRTFNAADYKRDRKPSKSALFVQRLIRVAANVRTWMWFFLLSVLQRVVYAAVYVVNPKAAANVRLFRRFEKTPGNGTLPSRTESYRLLLEKKEAGGSGGYEPLFLDNPDVRASKHSSVIRLPAYITTIAQYTKAARLKAALNEHFRRTFGARIAPDVTLSKIRTIKRKMVAIGTQLGLEIVTVAHAHVYFEKLVLGGAVTKRNRKTIAAVALLLARKINDDGRKHAAAPHAIFAYGHASSQPSLLSNGSDAALNYGCGASHTFHSHLLQSQLATEHDERAADNADFFAACEKHLAVHSTQILQHELNVFVQLRFDLLLEPHEYLPHFERIFSTLEFSNIQEYLGEKMFHLWKYSATK